jgi:ATP-dependent 26S proteasome regulatory subunit
VHRLRGVARQEVILPQKTLDLLDRNVIRFVQRRPGLSEFHMATKKGLLFYGPPGTGKTHTIRYLAKALPGHTTFLVSAEQVGLLAEYMTLARLLQPSVLVIEDVDLIARERTQMRNTGTELMLNKLLNEMDGLREDCEIVFILTTNRPEQLETALASRPGRIDQAIEFPLPDGEGRAKLIRLYSRGIDVSDELAAEIVKRTDKVSASFIKELMRRSAQFHLERNGSRTLTLADVDSALEEMLLGGGSLNLKLLGAEQRIAEE